jgi:hypothetical protein
MDPHIHFVCVRRAHRVSGGGVQSITVHAGEWAYCPDIAEAPGAILPSTHEWQPIDPVSLDEAVLAVRAEARTVGVAATHVGRK